MSEIPNNDNLFSTVVDWVFDQMPFEYTSSRAAFDVYQQARFMDMEQKKDAWDKGAVNNMRLMSGAPAIGFSQYYAETYELQESKVVDHLKTDDNDQHG